MSGDAVYARRVRDPNPLLEQLAREETTRLLALSGGMRPPVWLLARAAHTVGVPLDYFLDELERRVREADGTP